MKQYFLILLASLVAFLACTSKSVIEDNEVSGTYYGSNPLIDSYAAVNLAAAEVALSVARGDLSAKEGAEFMAVFSLIGPGQEKKIRVELRRWEHLKEIRGLTGFDELAQEHKDAADTALEKARQEKAAREAKQPPPA